MKDTSVKLSYWVQYLAKAPRPDFNNGPGHNASVNSKHQHPPPGRPPGKFFKVVKNPAPGQNFSAKARPPGQENTYPRGVLWKI